MKAWPPVRPFVCVLSMLNGFVVAEVMMSASNLVQPLRVLAFWLVLKTGEVDQVKYPHERRTSLCFRKRVHIFLLINYNRCNDKNFQIYILWVISHYLYYNCKSGLWSTSFIKYPNLLFFFL